MEHFFIYQLKTGICLALLYICSKAFLSNETFFRFNRFTLLLGVVVCFFIPLIQVDIHSSTFVQKPFVMMEELLVVENAPFESRFEQTDVSNPASQTIRIETVVWILFLAGSVINLIYLLKSTYAMFCIIRKGRKSACFNHTLVIVSQKIAPFSWGKYIVLSEEDHNDSPDEIICHEQAHIRHFHYIDILVMEFFLLFQWFNPVMWLLISELKDIHEYQADRSVLQSGIDAKKYQLLLVKKAVGASSYALANSFNHSKIKKRITMMLKEKSNQWARLKLLLLLPFGVLTVYAFARTAVNERNVNESVDSVIACESNLFSPEVQEIPEINGANVSESQVPTNQKPDYIPDYYLVDGEKTTIEQYDKLVKNSIRLDDMQYLPFVKGKIVKIQIVYTTGRKSLTYLREMYVDGKKPDRSHVYMVIDGEKREYNGQMWRLHKVKNELNGKFYDLSTRIYTNKEEAENYIQQHDISKLGLKTVECQFVTKDGTQASEKWYSFIIPPPPPPPPPPLTPPSPPPPPPPPVL
jgi:beta-lactamase regulating signal transducer with metallopeptidase domain